MSDTIDRDATLDDEHEWGRVSMVERAARVLYHRLYATAAMKWEAADERERGRYLAIAREVLTEAGVLGEDREHTATEADVERGAEYGRGLR